MAMNQKVYMALALQLDFSDLGADSDQYQPTNIFSLGKLEQDAHETRFKTSMAWQGIGKNTFQKYVTSILQISLVSRFHQNLFYNSDGLENMAAMPIFIFLPNLPI